MRAGRPAAAAAVFRALATQGDAQAMLALGGLYDLGEGVDADPRAALDWYRRAAATGLADAALDAGLMYDAGRGTARDPAQAALWYARAALRGNARAAYDLGLLYADGDGMARDDALAAAWFAEAASDGVTAAAARGALLGHASAGTVPAPPLLLAPSQDEAVAPPDDRQVALIWTMPAQSAPARFYVEVLALADTAHPVLQAYARIPAALVTVAPGASYAWRGYAGRPATRGYLPTGWWRFTVPGQR